jgi:hypothetical protein
MEGIKLNGKCKEDFEEWLEHPTEELEGRCSWIDTLGTQSTMVNIWCVEYFNQLPFSMQYGVYIDFFDSVGFIRTLIQSEEFLQIVEYGKTRAEARQKAIEKANEIYNEQKA